MTKEYYRILGVSENATQEEIKKSYRKLAQKWHPDKWNTKTFEEQKETNEKMQKINEAYEILSDGEKKAKYDAGETKFASEYSNNSFDLREEEIREREEKLKEKLYTSEDECIRLMKEIIEIQTRYLDRAKTDLEIKQMFQFNLNGDYRGIEIYPKHLDAKLWQPYENWGEKLWEMEITIPEGKKRSEELKNFKEEMFKAIEEAEIILKSKKSEKVNSEIDQARKKAIEAIEKTMTEKCLKAEDLEEKYRNYQEQLNNLEKVWKIRSLRDKIKESISEIGKQGKADDEFTPKENSDDKEKPKQPKNNEPTKPNSSTNDKNIPTKQGKYDNLSKGELINRIKQLEAKISELEEDIKALKVEPQQNSEIKREIQIRENQLKEVKENLIKLRNSNHNNNSQQKDNKFPTEFLTIGGISLVVIGLSALFVRKNKLKKR